MLLESEFMNVSLSVAANKMRMNYKHRWLPRMVLNTAKINDRKLPIIVETVYTPS